MSTTLEPEVQSKPLVIEAKAHDTSHASDVNGAVAYILKERKWEEHHIFRIQTAIEEALANALKHGNQSDAEKFAQIKIAIGAEHFRIEIEDQGPGFNSGDVPDPTTDENLVKPNGRGVLIMRAMMSAVVFSDIGNCVSMTYYRHEQGT
jgi:serine/threonine-protein kinase RsbW